MPLLLRDAVLSLSMRRVGRCDRPVGTAHSIGKSTPLRTMNTSGTGRSITMRTESSVWAAGIRVRWQSAHCDSTELNYWTPNAQCACHLDSAAQHLLTRNQPISQSINRSISQSASRRRREGDSRRMHPTLQSTLQGALTSARRCFAHRVTAPRLLSPIESPVHPIYLYRSRRSRRRAV